MSSKTATPIKFSDTRCKQPIIVDTLPICLSATRPNIEIQQPADVAKHCSGILRGASDLGEHEIVLGVFVLINVYKCYTGSAGRRHIMYR